jgi:DNA replication protein DnaC
VTSLKACEAGGYAIERKGDSAVARVLQQVEGCVDCGGTGLLRGTVEEFGRTYDVAKPCPRRRMEQRADLYNRAHIPAVHSSSTFDTYRAQTAEVHKGLSVAKDFALRWPQSRGYILSGPVGTGKTHLLAASLRHLVLELGVRAGYVEISLLYAQIRRGFNEGRSGGEIIGPLSQLDVLAIDELGKGRGSAFELETLDELIARRYNAGKVTLFATNYSLRPPEEKRPGGYASTEELKAEGKDSKLLCDRVGERIYSRLCEMCEFIEFPLGTPDQRRHKAETRSAPRRAK